MYMYVYSLKEALSVWSCSDIWPLAGWPVGNNGRNMLHGSPTSHHHTSSPPSPLHTSMSPSNDRLQALVITPLLFFIYHNNM